MILVQRSVGINSGLFLTTLRVLAFENLNWLEFIFSFIWCTESDWVKSCNGYPEMRKSLTFLHYKEMIEVLRTARPDKLLIKRDQKHVSF